jgi:membrane peptidoglycan carboxypeptidase
VQVLEWYLNSAYYGHLAFGADSAARLYLEKPAININLAEAALLMAAGQAPGLNPLDAPDAAIDRQRAILEVLLARGVINTAEHERALGTTVQIARPPGQVSTPAAAFSRLVLERLAERFGRERVERGGMKVITTLDYALQLQLSCLVRTQLSRLAGEAGMINLPDGSPCEAARLLPTLPPGGSPLPLDSLASAAVLDPQNGQVLALVGDTAIAGESSTLTPRAPGSLLTPFVALAGFARGTSPASLVWDIPASLPDPLAGYARSEENYHGPVRIRMAIANDYRAPQAKLLEQIGASNVWRLAGSLGLESLSNESSSSLIYEGGQVSPLDLAQAYGVFATQGQRVGQRVTAGGNLRPVMILYVEDANNDPLWDARQAETQAAVSPQLAYLVHNVLSDATARWPSLGYPNALEIGRPSGAKVGQVAGNSQAWTAGYTPQRVAVFWLGLPAAREGESELTPRMAAGMWHALMQYASRDLPASDWSKPEGISQVNVCDPSGQLPTADCPEVVGEVFLTGNEPIAPDSLYRSFQVNRETGRLATVFTSPSLVEEKTYLVVPPEASEWARAAGLPVPPENYDAIQPPVPSVDVRLDAPKLYGFVRGQVEIHGTAAGEGFRFYQLQVGPGLNPQNWQQIGPDGAEPVTSGALGSWDTTGQEGLYSIRLLVVRTDQRVETAVTQVTIDNTPPLVRIPYPTDGQEFALSTTKSIIFQAEVTDTIGIRKVTWLVDGSPVGETLDSPYAFSWQAARGQHTLEVIAADLAGNETRSAPVRFTIK